MAKVTGPLFSLDARNSIGKAVVYSFWNGVNYVRSRVIPANPKSDLQAEVRTKLGAIGKNNKAIVPDKTLATQIKAVTPGTQSWMSYLASTMAGLNFSFFDSKKSAYAASSNRVKFDSEAALIPLNDFDIGYGSYGSVPAGAQLYICAAAAFALGLPIAPVDPDSMTDEQIEAFANAYTS
jgi:hypothetical protein